MYISLIKNGPYTLTITYISPSHPYMLAHVVPTVHGTERLLVARELCAHIHFLCSIGRISSSRNVILVSPSLRKNGKLIYTCILLWRNQHDVQMEHKKFIHNPRIFVNSLYLLFCQFQEFNMRTLSRFGLPGKQSSDFCKNILCNFQACIRASIFYIKRLKLDLLVVVERKHAIHVLSLSHHKRYIGCSPLHGLVVKFISLLLFLLAF